MASQQVEDLTRQNAEAVIKRLSDYLAIRFDLACRINPTLVNIKDDLMYHEVENVRRCLIGAKIYGAHRATVANVLMSDNEQRRRGLMSPTDQTSIQVELVSHCQEQMHDTTRGQIKIHDLKTFYAAINPVISEMLDLFETWIWWDILDSADLARFEAKLGRINSVRQGKASTEMRKAYGAMIHGGKPGEEDAAAAGASDVEIINYEFKHLLQIRKVWLYRRDNELGYMYVLKRDEEAASDQGVLIHQIADRVREYDRIEHLDGELDDDTRHRYGIELKCAPENVTRERVLEILQQQLIDVEREMLLKADHQARLGPPYNYKRRQLDLMDKWLKDLKMQLGDKLVEPKAAAAPAAT